MKILWALSVLFAAALCRAELLPDPELRKMSAKEQTELQYWRVERKGRTAVAEKKAEGGIEFSSNGGRVAVSGKNFRLRTDKFSLGIIYLSARIDGAGTVRFSLFCYDSKGKFMKSFQCGEAPFQSAAVTAKCRDLPEGTAAFVPVLTLDGRGTVKKISCTDDAESNLEKALPPDFSRLPLSERLKIIDRAEDYRIPLAVLMLPDDPADRECQLRFMAAYKLGLGGEKALPAAKRLTQQLSHRNEAVRVHSAAALTRMGPTAYPLIKKVLLSNSWGGAACAWPIPCAACRAERRLSWPNT